MVKEEIIIDKAGIREDLLGWHIKEVTDLAATYDQAFQIVRELLHDKNPLVRANALQVIKELIKKNFLGQEKVSMVLDDVIELVNDKNERASLKALEVLNLLLDVGEISEEAYERITDALMEIIKRGAPILSEYASEGLGKTGAKVLRIARKLIEWLFSLIRSSEDRQVQSAAITALTEMAYRTDDKKVFNEIFEGMTDLVDSTDPYIQERALLSIERMLARAEMLTPKNRMKALQKVKEVKGNVLLASKASTILEKLEKLSGTEEELTESEVRKMLEISEYGPEDVEKLLNTGKTEIVAELAKVDPVVMSMIIDMLSSDDPTRRMDALWVVSRSTSSLTPSDAYSVLPVLGEFLKSHNPWARQTAAETMAEIYSLYPGTAQFFTSLLDVLLKSGRREDIEGALELIHALRRRMPTPEFNRAIMAILIELLQRKEAREVTLKFLAREAQELINMDYEALTALKEALRGVYGDEGGKYDNLIAAILDVVEDLLKLKSQES
ncbi:HEAT repeat domain-containing protein [Thermococcus waiotapuensis]|uniref:Condensin complex subunit 1 C-terminal domain-containing protein n=1 Tax=Thermococcus waiotapuensis TaxID=90909 RepID=A0AAE4NWU8_9EURY|nr:hypothetical protein [Thermococcus waiotapuensis]MDV3104145.1 hypothetical protein [Thermococcus waiotapuensis]